MPEGGTWRGGSKSTWLCRGRVVPCHEQAQLLHCRSSVNHNLISAGAVCLTRLYIWPVHLEGTDLGKALDLQELHPADAAAWHMPNLEGHEKCNT